TESLIAEAQVIQYKNWQSRLKKRSDSLDALQAIVAQVEPKPEQEESQDSNYFDSALKRCELLTRYKATLDEHVSAQAIENLLLADLTSEQRHIIEETLADSEKKEASLKEVLNVALNEARWVLFEAYFKKIESLEKENLAEALRHLDHVLVLRVPEKGDATFPKELDDRIAAIKERLLFLELASITKLLMNTEKAGADILHHVYAVLKKPPQPAISSEFKEVIKTAQKNCTKKDIEFHLKHNDFQAAEEILTQFYSDIEIVRRSSVFKEEDFFALEYDLRLQIIERYIGQNNLEEARNKMKALLAQTKARKYILDLRSRAGFDNAAFWKGIYLQNIAIHLNENQYQALSLSQRQYYNEPLFRAIEKGDAAAVQHGVEFLSWDVDLSNEAGRMPIISACWYGHLDIAQYLFKKGGQIVKIERVGENVNPLNGLIDLKYHEDKARYKPIILWLIENGLEFEPKHALILDEKELFEKSFEQFPSGAIRKQKIRDFLETAVKEGAEAAVIWMLEAQKECVASFPKVESKLPFFSLFNDVPIDSKKEPSLLHIACIKGQVSIVEILSSAKELDVPGAHANKQSALHYLTQLFFEYYPGAGSINETFDEFNRLYAKWRAIAQILCQQGAKHTLYTRLMLNQQIEGLSYYIKKENINKPCDSVNNTFQHTPLHIAVKTQNIPLVQFLIQQNARLNVMNKKGETPLYLACELGNVDIVQLLLNAKASPNGPRRELTDTEKMHLSALDPTFTHFKAFVDKKTLVSPEHSPLRCAILREHTIIIQRLCQAGADLEEKYDGKTALHWAVQTENQKSVAILLQHGAKISKPNNEGQTPKQLAAKIGNVAIMMLLTTADLEQSLVCNDRVKARYLNALGEWTRGEKPPASLEPSANSSASSQALSSSSLSLFTPVRSESLGSTFVLAFEQYLAPDDGSIVLDPLTYDSAEDEVLTPPEPSEPVFYSPSNSPGNTG
ncbi:MAG: ankyrin repeat domain-containing protein, partial [Gammaproteobacteria bacterium]|nr:ankyrin repeat domain-containing protein [Gammaproteobacteria bacterium]